MGSIRLVLALAVIAAHTGPFFGFPLIGGPQAVQLFFIISGFYMTLILNEKYTGPGSYTLFASNRALRLFPLYWTVLVATVVISVIAGFSSGHWLWLSPWVDNWSFLSGGTFALLGIANVFIFGQDLVMFLGANAAGHLEFTHDFRSAEPQLWTLLQVPAAWSLALELTFYALAPFIVRRRLPIILAIIGACLAFRVVMHLKFGLSADPWSSRFFPFELGVFLLGTVSWHILKHIEAVGAPSRAVLLTILVGYMLLVTAFAALPYNNGLPFFAKKWVLFGLTAVAIPYIFTLTKSWRFDAAIGELSYPIYIVHGLIISVCAGTIASLGIKHHEGLIVSVIAIVVSLLMIRVISDPIESFRRARVARAKAAKPAV